MNKNVWFKYSVEEKEELDFLSDDYREYITYNKTERENVKSVVNIISERGFVDLEYCISNNIPLQAGDRVFVNNMNKSIALFVIGKEDITKGINI